MIVKEKYNMRSKDTQRIVYSGMFIALVTAATFINIPYPGVICLKLEV